MKKIFLLLLLIALAATKEVESTKFLDESNDDEADDFKIINLTDSASALLNEDGEILLGIPTDQIISKVVDVVCKVWNAIVKIFGYSEKTERVKLVTAKGFKYYSSATEIILLQNCTLDADDEARNEKNIKKVANSLNKILGVKKDKSDLTRNIVENVIDSKAGIWNEQDLFFEKAGRPGTISYGSVLSTDVGDGKFNILIVSSFATFELSDDVYWVKTTKQLGIISKDETQYLAHEPRSITKQDLEVLFYFFKLSSYQKIAARAGVELKIPEGLEK